MERRNSVIKLTVLCFLIAISISWYGRINITTKQRKKIEIPITFNDAKKELATKANPNKNYFFQKSLIVEKKRTYIPFVYKRDTTFQSEKQLYSKKIK